MKNFLTLLIAMLLLLPTAMHGTGKKVVTSIDITIPLPKDGMGIEDGEQIQITAAKTAYGDLVQQGIASVFSILWEGEFNRKNSDSPKFQAGYTYRASMKLMLDTQSPYIIKYAMRDGDYYVDDTMLKITVNGEPARVLVGSPYFPRCSFVVTVPGGDGGNLKRRICSLTIMQTRRKTVPAIMSIQKRQPMHAVLHSIPMMWSPLLRPTTRCQSLKDPTESFLPRLS